MKRIVYLFAILGLLLQPVLIGSPSVSADGPSEPEAVLPGYPEPSQPIPYNHPGTASKMSPETRASLAASYQPWANAYSELSAEQAAQSLTYGADYDPLISNYTLANWDEMGVMLGNTTEKGFQVYSAGTLNAGKGVTLYTDVKETKDRPSVKAPTLPAPNKVAQAGDINGDGVDELVSLTTDGKMSVANLGDRHFSTGAPAAASLDNGTVWVFVRGYDDQLWGNFGGGWVPLGGTLASSPTVTATGPAQMDILVLDTQNKVQRCAVKPDTTTCAWKNLGAAPQGHFVGEPAVPQQFNTSSTYAVFARGSDNTLWYGSYSGGPVTWTPLGGYIISSPAAAASNGRLDVVARGYDNAIWHLSRANGSAAWSAWERLPGDFQFTYAPSITWLDANTIEVYAVANNPNAPESASNHKVYSLSYIGGKWSAGGWTDINSAKAYSSPISVLQKSVMRGLLYYLLDNNLVHIINRILPAPAWNVVGDFPPLNVWSSTTPVYNFTDFRLGHFLPDGRMQAMAYFLGTNKLYLELYKLQGGFTPERVQTATLDFGFNVTGTPVLFTEAGDFDGNGADELAVLVYNHPLAYVYIIQMDGGSIFRSTSVKVNLAPLVANADGYQLILTHGNYDGEQKVGDRTDTSDEIAVFAGQHLTAWTKPEAELFIYNANSGDLKLTQAAYNAKIPWSYWEAYSAASGNFAAFAGDKGADEIVLAGIFPKYQGWWYHREEISVIRLANDGSIKPEISSYFAGDMFNHADFGLVAKEHHLQISAADLNRDGMAEIVTFYERKSSAYYSDQGARRIRYFKLTAGDAPTLSSPAGTDEWSGSMNPPSQFLTGSFTGKSLRLAKPTYRLIDNAASVVARVATPPKLEGIYEGEAATAFVNFTQSTSAKISSEAKSHWNLDTSISMTLGNEAVASVTLSLETSVGQDFSKVSSQQTTTTFNQTLNASTDDVLLFGVNDFKLFEYPVSDGANGSSSKMLVVWTKDPGAISTVSTHLSACGLNINPGHVINNGLSYPYSPTGLTDHTGAKGIANTSFTTGSDGGGYSVTYETVSDAALTQETAWSVGAGVEGKFQAPIPLSVSASVKGKYSENKITTQTNTITRNLNVGGNYTKIANPNANYTIEPYFYWTTGGALVLDYLMIPDQYKTWWNTNPPAGSPWKTVDLAFILPWQGQNCMDNQDEMSPDVTFVTEPVSGGTKVTVNAVVHNYSLTSMSTLGQSAQVTFYKGDPSAKVVACTANPVSVNSREATTATCSFTQVGSGEWKIYAVIDENNTLVERKEDNNRAFGKLSIAPPSAAGVDPGLSDVKDGKLLSLVTQSGKKTDLFIPYTGLVNAAVTSFKLDNLMPGDRPYISTTTRLAFDIAAFEVDQKTASWGARNTPLYLSGQNHQSPPAWLVVRYSDADISAGKESALKLYYWNGTAWEIEAGDSNQESICGKIFRDTANNVLMARVCHTGTFQVLGTTQPYKSYMPTITK